jgi:hypothetical protein
MWGLFFIALIINELKVNIMAEKNNATCAICGSSYHLCMSCKSLMNLQPWKVHTDTSEHYKVYQVIHGYSTGVYDKGEAKSKLETIDLSDLDSFRTNIKDIIYDILGMKKVVEEDDNKKSKAVSKKKSSDMVETE